MLESFRKSIQRVYFFLKLIDVIPDIRDEKRTIWARFRCHPILLVHILALNLQLIADILFLVDALKTRQKFLEITICFPLCALTFLSNFKTISTVIYAPYVYDLIERLDKLQSVLSSSEAERNDFVPKLMCKHVIQLNTMSTRAVYLISATITFLGLSPLAVMLSEYYSSGEIELFLPLSASYPFNINGVRYFSVYIFQLWSAFLAAFFQFGPDYLFFTVSTFIYIQFLILQYDMERIVDEDFKKIDNETFKSNLKNLVTRHVELIRCVELLERIYSKPILFNAFISSLTICISGFIILVLDNILRMTTFLFILTFSLLQTLFYCYCGDNIMRASAKINDAIYNSPWYNLDVSGQRSCLFIMRRAQRPCKLTATGMFDVNLIAFANILMNTWSYFTLLNTMIDPDIIKS